MIIIRSSIFVIFFVFWTALLSSALIPLTWFGNKAASNAGKIWANGIILMLKIICNITHEVKGIENIPNSPCIVASKHQSTWDTMIFFTLINHPIFVLKKELLKIPLFGSFLSRMGMIAVDRKGGASALKQMLAQVKDRTSKGMSLIVFPEGTRTDIGQRIKYHPGIASIYKEPNIDIPVIPVALNSAKYWSKNSFLKYPGNITIEFLPPIEKDLSRKDFMTKLQDSIENSCNNMK